MYTEIRYSKYTVIHKNIRILFYIFKILTRFYKNNFLLIKFFIFNENLMIVEEHNAFNYLKSLSSK